MRGNDQRQKSSGRALLKLSLFDCSLCFCTELDMYAGRGAVRRAPQLPGWTVSPSRALPAVAPELVSPAIPTIGTLRLGQSVDFVWDVTLTSVKDSAARIDLPTSSELRSSVIEGSWSLCLSCQEIAPLSW